MHHRIKEMLLMAGMLMLLLPWCNTPGFSQVYQLRKQKEFALAGSGLGLNLSAALLNLRPIALSETQVLQLQTPEVWSPDRFSLRHYDKSARRASDYLWAGATILPLTLLADKSIRQESGKISLMLMETALITNGLTNFVKQISLRNRPFVYNPQAPLSEKTTNNARLSFFSGHTSMTASFTFFTAKVWNDFHHDSQWKPIVWTTAALIPAFTGYFRMKGGKHYFTDVLAGYVVGAAIGYLVPHWHQTR